MWALTAASRAPLAVAPANWAMWGASGRLEPHRRELPQSQRFERVCFETNQVTQRIKFGDVQLSVLWLQRPLQLRQGFPWEFPINPLKLLLDAFRH